MRNSRIVGGSIVTVGGLIAVIGSFLPWARLETGIFSVSKGGLEGDGVLTLIAGGIIILMGALILFLEENIVPAVVAVLGGLACVAVAIIDLVDLMSSFSGLSSEALGVKAGEGLIMVLVGGIVVIGGSVAGIIGYVRREKKPPGAAPLRYICPYCGSPVAQGARFCIRCGARFY